MTVISADTVQSTLSKVKKIIFLHFYEIFHFFVFSCSWSIALFNPHHFCVTSWAWCAILVSGVHYLWSSLELHKYRFSLQQRAWGTFVHTQVGHVRAASISERCQVPERKAGRRKGYSRILTSTSEKLKIIESEKRKCRKVQRGTSAKELTLPSFESDDDNLMTADEVTRAGTLSPRAGSWYLVSIRGRTRKKCIDFRYVGRATADVDEDGDTQMNGYRSVDESETLFKISENDIFAVPLTDIICQLRNPVDEILSNGRKAHVRFSGSIYVKEC